MGNQYDCKINREHATLLLELFGYPFLISYIYAGAKWPWELHLSIN
jgi:hypothetical protein